MSRLFNKIDNLDLTSILSENEALDKLKESEGKYCKNCFTLFETEGDLCDSCKSITEVSEFDREVVLAVQEIGDNLAIMGCSDITELDYDEQKELITDTLNDMYGEGRWSQDLFKEVVRDFALNVEKLCDNEVVEAEETEDGNISPVEVEDSESDEKEDKEETEDTDKDKNKEETEDETSDEDEEDEKSDKEEAIEDLQDNIDELEAEIETSIEDIQSKISDLKDGIEGLSKLEDVSDKTTFELDGKEYTEADAKKEIESLTKELKELSQDKNNDLETAFGDNELRESEEYLEPTPEMSIKEWYTALAPDDYQLDKIPSDITFQFLHDNLDKYSISSLIGEIDSDPRNTIINAMCDVFNIDDAYSVEYSDDLPPYERNISESSEIMEVNLTQIDLALDALIEIEEVIEIEGSIDQDLMLSRVNIALDELKDPEYEEARKPLQNILDIVADERSIDQDLMLSYVKDAMDTLNRMALTESIMTTTTVDNIDQESKDKATIDKAIEIAGDKTTIDNDTFRELRLKLANKDYDVIDRLKDYALVRGEDVVYTWLRAEDENLKEGVNINITDGNVSVDTDDNVNVSVGDTNINIDTTSNESEPALDLPVEEPAAEIIDEPETEEVLGNTKLINEIKEGVMINNKDMTVDELAAIFDNGDASGFTGSDWEKELYNIYFSDEIWDELDANADQVVSSATIKDMIGRELEVGKYNPSTTLNSLAELIGIEYDVNESEDLVEEDDVVYCYAQLPTDPKTLIVVTKDEAGYLPVDVDFDNEETAVSYMNKMNSALGITDEERDNILRKSMWAEDALQVDDIPAKIDQDEKHRRIELARLESEDKVTYRVSYLKEDDEEIAGWDIEADNDEDAVEALNKFADADTIADELLSAEFISTGIDGISSLNYKNTNILLSTDENENIITINQDNEDPVVIKGATFDEVMNQLVYWFIMNLDEETEAEETETSTEVEGE